MKRLFNKIKKDLKYFLRIAIKCKNVYAIIIIIIIP